MSNNLIKQDLTPLLLIQQAMDKGLDLDKLEKFMAMQERWEKKEAKKSFLNSLSKFQSIVPELKKSKTAKIVSLKGNFSYKYADLGSITAQIKPALNDCGLSYRWEFNESGEKLKVTCFISHLDGHTESTSMEAGKDASGSKNDIQQKGSTQTYLQRYTLIGALGLSTAEEDVDGKGHKRSQPEESEDDYLDQWKSVVAQTKTPIELQKLYLQNKKAVESDKAIQAIFKAHEAKIKPSQQTVEMP